MMVFKVLSHQTSLCFCEMSLQSFSDRGENFSMVIFVPSQVRLKYAHDFNLKKLTPRSEELVHVAEHAVLTPVC